MPSINRKLGLRIKRLREDRGQTQNELANLSGISLKHLGEMERGRGNPSLKCMEKLAASLDVSLSELFNFNIEEKPEDILRAEICERLKDANRDALRVSHRALVP